MLRSPAAISRRDAITKFIAFLHESLAHDRNAYVLVGAHSGNRIQPMYTIFPVFDWQHHMTKKV
jgi:hypothetical protein